MSPDLTVTPDTTGTPEQPQTRPEVAPADIAAIKDWFVKTDNLTQRKNALWEYRESNKVLFPARFNPNDPRRGQTPFELQSGRDQRRVQTPYIYRGTLQITAMSVPPDLEFRWDAKEQVQPPSDPNMPPVKNAPDPLVAQFGSTLRITQKQLLEEANWIEKLRAWVQDSCTFPLAILKVTFRREYQTTSLNANPGDKDVTDAAARLQSLMTQYAAKDFDDKDARYAEMQQMVVSLKENARISRYFCLEIQLIPMDAFGVSEECTDLVNVYDAPYMFHDALITGDDILARYPYRTGADGKTYGVLPEELNSATPWDTLNSSTDPNARNRSSRNKQLTAPNTTPLNTTSSTSAPGVDARRRQYVVREIWSKRTRTVITVIRGLEHYVDLMVPQKTAEQWYPFHLLAPNRVPTEIYQASDVELKRDIQNRIHRKRSDDEKARWLHLPRGIYNRAAGVDEKEMVKLQEIPPGQLRGINFGTQQQKIDDMVQWFEYKYDPMSFDTAKDEQDMDQMGALPVQAMGTTGSAKFATEVNVASAGSAVAAEYRKSIIQSAIDRLLAASAELLLQELSVDEVQLIAGAFAFWPTIYDDVEAAQIVEDARTRAAQTVAPQVIAQAIQGMQMGGPPPDPKTLGPQVEQLANPIWQSEMMTTYGSIEPPTRQSIFQRLKVEVKSDFNGRMEKQQHLAMFAQLGEACMQIGQAAQGTGTPFVMREIMMQHADLLGGPDAVDKAFPTIDPMMIAKQLAVTALANANAANAAPGEGPPGNGPPGGPPSGETPSGQGDQGAKVDPVEQAQNAIQGTPAPMGV